MSQSIEFLAHEDSIVFSVSNSMHRVSKTEDQFHNKTMSNIYYVDISKYM
jgi:hypothetical protein